MKRKIFSVLLTVALVLGFSLVTAAPAGAVVVTLKVRPYGLYTGDNGTSVWSTDECKTGSSSVKLTHTANEGSVYVDFVPPAGVTLADFQADITATTPVWSFEHFLQNTGVTNGPQFELYFDDPDSASWLEVTAVGLQGTTGTEAWVKETLGTATLAGYGGVGEGSGGTGSFFNWGTLTALSGIEAAVELEGTVIEASDWVLTRVRVELWEDIDQFCYIDDIEIAGDTYYGSIQDAIDIADEGDDIITVAEGTYVGNLIIDEDMTITCTTTTITGDVHFDASSITMTGATLGTGYEWYLDSETASIQDAIDAASASDTINVAAGTYNEQVIINKANLTVESVSGAATTIIDGTGLDPGVDALVWLQADGITFKDFTVQNCPRTAGGAALWVANPTPASGISECVVTENIIAETNESVYSILLTAASSCEVSDNEISDSGLNGVTFSGSEGVCLTNTITLNTITGSRGCAINLHSGATASFAGTVISENIIHGGGFGIALGEANGTSDNLIVIRDNDILDIVTGLDASPANGISTNNSSYVDVYSNDVKDGIKGIAVYGTHANVTFRYNDITGNSLYGLDAILATGGDVNAKYNYWGDPSGPTITATNPRGDGDAVTTSGDLVVYEPWLHTTQATVYPSNTRYYAYNWVDLTKGWNIWSTPIALDSQADTWKEYRELGVDLDLAGGSDAYYFTSSGTWANPGDSYELIPCDALYIKVASDQKAPILFSPSYSAPAKTLSPGWNLVSASFIDNIDSPDIDTGVHPQTVLASVYNVAGPYNTGYSMVVSPAVNQTAWSGVRGIAIDTAVGEQSTGAGTGMLPCKGYWVFMTNGGTLAGTVFTPVSPLLLP